MWLALAVGPCARLIRHLWLLLGMYSSRDRSVNLQAHILGDPAAQRRAEVAERDTLVQLVNNQAQQLETLRAQLLALRSKSGPVS